MFGGPAELQSQSSGLPVSLHLLQLSIWNLGLCLLLQPPLPPPPPGAKLLRCWDCEKKQLLYVSEYGKVWGGTELEVREESKPSRLDRTASGS